MTDVEIPSGKNVEFGVSDPDDFSFENGSGPFKGIVITHKDESLLVKLEKPLTYDGCLIWGVLASARHRNEPLQKIMNGEAIAVNLLPIVERSSLNSIESAFKAIQNWRRWHLIGGMTEA